MNSYRILPLITFTFMFTIVSSGRLQNTYFKNSYFIDSSRVDGQKYYSFKLNQITKLLNDSHNSILNELFNEHLYYHLNEKIKPEIVSGIPVLNIPCLDPFEINQIKLNSLIGNNLFQITLTNFKLNGLSKYSIKNISSRLNELKFKLTVLFPSLEANCSYLVNGTLYDVLKLHGFGFGTIKYLNVLIRVNVKLNRNNESLTIASAESPFVDYSQSIISLKSEDGRISSTSDSIASELGPILFWMLADELIEKIDQYSYTYLNQVLKTFKLPIDFKPAITWLVKRTLPSFKHFSPVSFFYHFYSLINEVKSQINIPLLIESLKNIQASFRSSFKNFI